MDARDTNARSVGQDIMVTVLILVPVLLLSLNAVIAFVIAFYWQLRVMITIFVEADWTAWYNPWKAMANPNSQRNLFARFLKGEVFPDLRRKWLRALGYVGISYLAVFLIGGGLMLLHEVIHGEV